MYLLTALLLACLTSASVDATTLMRMSVAQLSRAAGAIVRVRCIANENIWDAGEIWTRTTFEVEDVWSGAPADRGPLPQRIAVRLLGGTFGNITSHVSGIPRFHAGEEAVLFLEPTTRGDFSVISWQQGTFRIHRDVQTGDEAVTQDTASFATYDPASRRFEQAGIRRMRLADFRSLVEAALAAAAAPSAGGSPGVHSLGGVTPRNP
jgi:hypothetical protein